MSEKSLDIKDNPWKDNFSGKGLTNWCAWEQAHNPDLYAKHTYIYCFHHICMFCDKGIDEKVMRGTVKETFKVHKNFIEYGYRCINCEEVKEQVRDKDLQAIKTLPGLI